MNEKQKTWIRKLRHILHHVPNGFAVRQSNIDTGLMLFDSETGERIEYGFTIFGFAECDPVENIINNE